ncbi:phosphoribosylformylglycinamidine synthase subunit PurQ [candidate division FCPU426 bacterium]|nr:phosphoribosylformylglycinamidine synthase subunit PurQ [candidate division FCPU426 bacterium]
MKFGVVVFPGSNCDHDCYAVVRDVLRQPVTFIWHGQKKMPPVDCLILPGGFSYGDYLRTGAIARFSPVLAGVRKHAHSGKPVIGICNGFQILLEAGLLPGAMLRNRTLTFICKYVFLSVASPGSPFSRHIPSGTVLRIPVAHGEGNYYCDPATLSRLRARKQIIFRYSDSDGQVTADANPNGSVDNIAGICNEEGNVLGMMPHPERCMEPEMGSMDGLKIFRSLLASVHTVL